MPIKTVPGVSLAGLHFGMRIALIAVEHAYMDEGKPHATITSTTDGEHSAGSMHYYGLAFDVRTRADNASPDIKGDWWAQWSTVVKARLARRIKARLPDGFDVVVESTHIHVELDPAAYVKVYLSGNNIPSEYLKVKL